MINDLQNVIAFLESIPESEWCEGSQDNGKGQKCALGHMRSAAPKWRFVFDKNVTVAYPKYNTSCYGNGSIVNHSFAIAAINNGETLEYQQATPKQRTLAAFYDLQKEYEAVEATKNIINSAEVCKQG